MGIIHTKLQNDKLISFEMAVKKLGLIIHLKRLIAVYQSFRNKRK